MSPLRTANYMSNMVYLSLFLLAVSSLAPAALAQLPPPNAQLNELVSTGQYQRAWEIASANVEVWEGDTQFDLLYGIAALESGRPNEAVFALQRAVATAQTSLVRQRARLELARAHLLTDNLLASEDQFQAVLASNPPQNVRDNIQAFLALIEIRQQQQRPSVTWNLSSALGHDDNINSATSNGLIDTPIIGEIELDPSGLKTRDEFVDLGAVMVYKRPVSRDRSVDVTLNLNRHDNLSSSRFDIDYGLADISYNHGNNRNRFRHGLQTQKIMLDGEGFQSSYRFNNSWQHAGNGGWYQALSLSVAANRFDSTDDSPRANLRDTNQALLSGSIIKLSRSFTHNVTLFYAHDDALREIGEHNGRDYYGIAHSVSWRLSNRHMPFSRLSIQETKYHNEHPVFFLDTRSDTAMSATLGWVWQFNNRFALNAEMSYTRTDSNIPLFEYTRFRYQAGLRYQI